ncbi:MAG: FAD-dependent oxidoreductase [Candidatus Omnitrophica bacterium]|nr:FAD-dependent oxidoreductase [Candidatus Omnitrophota bacterium]
MKNYLIIGNSAAGISAVEAIRSKDKESKITLLSSEDYPGYCRCLISYFLAGQIKEDKLLYRPESFYKDNNVELFLNKKVSRVDPKKNKVVCEDRTQISYDQLLIATGSSPKFPEIQGIKKKGVFGLRTVKDTKEIDGLLPITRAAAVLGGGLVGLKAAYALKKRGVDVKVVIKSDQVLSQMLDFEAALFVQKRLEENGIDVVLGQDVKEIIGEGDIRAVKLSSGKTFEASLIVVGKGVSPNIDLVKDAEIKTGEGIVTDKLLQTNVPNIYASGDVAETFDITIGKYAVNALWPVAIEQGRIAGANMTGDAINYDGSLGINSIEFFGLPTVSLGIYKKDKADTSLEELKLSDAKSGKYKKLTLRGNLLIGAILVGDIKSSGLFLRLIREKIDISPIKDKLLEENFGFPDLLELIKDKEKIYV